MSQMKSERDERVELDKYVKFFCVKAVHFLYCSRQSKLKPMVHKVDSNARPWFNIQTPDSVDIAHSVKRMLDQQLPSPLKSLIVQVSMIAGSSKTVIEAWKVAKSEECDKSAKIITGVYSKLALLLKSLICVSRCTPAYKLCRNSNVNVETDFFFGEVSDSFLNEECEKPRRLGIVKTPYGSLSVSVLCKSMQQIDRVLKTHNEILRTIQIGSGAFPRSEFAEPFGSVGIENSGASTGSPKAKSCSNENPPQTRDFPITAAFASKSGGNAGVKSTGGLIRELSIDDIISCSIAKQPTASLRRTQTTVFDAGPKVDFLKQSKEWKRLSAPNIGVRLVPETTIDRRQALPLANRSARGDNAAVTSREQESDRPEFYQPAFATSSGCFASSISSAQNSSDAAADCLSTDVGQFFRIVQQASCLQKNEPQEGLVISHNMQLGEYVTSFNEIGDELHKLIYNNE